MNGSSPIFEEVVKTNLYVILPVIQVRDVLGGKYTIDYHYSNLSELLVIYRVFLIEILRRLIYQFCDVVFLCLK